MLGNFKQASSSSSSLPEQLWSVMLLHMPLSRDLGRLYSTCSAARAALNQHLAAIRDDVSLGAEPRHPIPMLVPPSAGPLSPPPAPLDFTYLHVGALDCGLGMSNDGCGGCDENCCCCCNTGAGEMRDPADANPGSSGSLGGSATNGASESTCSLAASLPARNRSRSDGGGSHRALQRKAVSKACGCGVVMPGGRPGYNPETGVLLPPLRQEGQVKETTGRSAAQAGPGAYLLECGPACACACVCGGGELPRGAGSCPARLTQGGLAVRLQLRWLVGKVRWRQFGEAGRAVR
ncbi:hypothetical protein Agub_g10528 [Astrephomene gubernaculifera]|uniref:Uncharacterized protein n=1 Tax=Astrephomene gubernaculifera TaxID=47775 RepID=A0AAD3DV14_9CHLO|nr:hypothetical protein Agub_g10528 [Astrephomene gubernaculifera]